MAYQLAATAVTLNDLEGHSLVVGLFKSEQGMGRWVMGQMGHENRMGHMGHGSLGVDP